MFCHDRFLPLDPAPVVDDADVWQFARGSAKASAAGGE
jgi:hypothetical protein